MVKLTIAFPAHVVNTIGKQRFRAEAREVMGRHVDELIAAGHTPPPPPAPVKRPRGRRK